MSRIRFLIAVALLVVAFFVTFSAQSGRADDATWQERQQARFEQTRLNPGEAIGKEDWNKIDDLLPPSIMGWLKEGYLGDIKIGEFKYDPAADEEFTKASLKNKGKFRLDEEKILLEAATGEPPLCMDGLAFPGIDLKNDPDGAIKYMYNRLVCESRKRTFKVAFTSEWISKKGLDRSIESFWIEYRYWSRPLVGEARNPEKHLYREITPVIKPYDLAGTVQMCIRYLDETEDDVYVYIPAIRRVKKMSGANRSDPYMGSDGCADDKFGWSGKIISMKWRFLGQKVGLLCVTDWVSEHTLKTRRLPDGTWKAVANEVGMKVGWQVKDFKGTQWAPANAVWIPRDFIIIESIPKDPYYNYGKIIYWIDKDTHSVNYKLVWDKAGEYWKTLIIPRVWVDYAEKEGVLHCNSHIIYDEKAKHASVYHHGGPIFGHQVSAEFDSPKINPRMFTLERLRMWSK